MALSRRLNAAVAQLGPIHLADSRASVVERLMALLRQAHGRGARFVVFPELALTTFFPRWWMTDQAEIDRFFEREMPNAGNPAVVRSRQGAGGRVLPRLCRIDPRDRASPGITTPRSWSNATAGSSDVIARSICRATPSICPTPRSSISKSAISISATRASKSGAPMTRSSACASATTGAGPRLGASWGCKGSRSWRSATTRRS